MRTLSNDRCRFAAAARLRDRDDDDRRGMQPYTLTLDKFLQHAAKWHPESGSSNRARGGQEQAHSLCRTRARVGCSRRARRLRRPQRVIAFATLAWNTQSHVEAWYPSWVMVRFAILSNPRLLCAPARRDGDAIGARILVVSADLLLARRSPSCDHGRTLLVLDAQDRC